MRRGEWQEFILQILHKCLDLKNAPFTENMVNALIDHLLSCYRELVTTKSFPQLVLKLVKKHTEQCQHRKQDLEICIDLLNSEALVTNAFQFFRKLFITLSQNSHLWV